MSISLLRTLVAIGDLGTFSAAAKSVNLTQAAVGQQMKRLEQQLDIALFDRNGSTPTLTPLARALIPKARDLINDYDALLDDLTGDTRLVGEFSLGAVPSSIRALVPMCLKRLRGRAPRLHIRVVPGLSADMLEQVERGAIQAAILSEPAQHGDNLWWQPFAVEPLVLLVAAGLEGDEPLQLLTQMPYIRHTRRAAVGLMADQWLSDHNVNVQVAMEMESIESVASMVLHNLGVSIVPDICVPDAAFAGLRKLPLPKPRHDRTLGLMSRKDTRQRQLLDVLFDELCATVNSIQGASA